MATSPVTPTSTGPPTFTLDSSTANKLGAYYVPPVLPTFTVPGVTPSPLEIEDWDFFVDQNLRLYNLTQQQNYGISLNHWAPPGTTPTTAPPAPPAYVTGDPVKYHQLLMAWSAQPATEAFDPSGAIIPAPLPPAPILATAVPPAPSTDLSLVGAYLQGVWLATPFAVALAQQGVIIVDQTVIPWAQSPTGYVEYVPLASFNGAGIWIPCSKNKAGGAA